MRPSLIFTIISLWYTWISVRTLVRFRRERRTLFDATVTPSDRALLDRGAFFLLVPLGVLLHEVGHAVATWQVGGRVVEFRWFIFWGYVVPEGSFDPLQHWWIALSGNVFGALLALLALTAVFVVNGRAWRYWMLSFGRLQLFYALLFYPAFSMITNFGDWPYIYAPLLSGSDLATADESLRPFALTLLGTHVGLLAMWFVAERSINVRRKLVSRFAPPAVAELQSRAAHLGDAETLSRLAVEYARLGEAALAEDSFKVALRQHPHDPIPALNAASFEAHRGRYDRAAKLYATALEHVREPRLESVALEGLATAELAHGRPDQALPHLDRALALDGDDGGLRLLRAQVRRRLDDTEGARDDVERAAESADPDIARQAETLRAELDLA